VTWEAIVRLLLDRAVAYYMAHPYAHAPQHLLLHRQRRYRQPLLMHRLPKFIRTVLRTVDG
jgi:hypothetical protein